MSEFDVTIFVSRPLESNSNIKIYLKSIHVEFEAISLIDFSQTPFLLPNTDWLFFYSKSGVRFFFDQLNQKIDLSIYKYASFGVSTGKYLEKQIGRALDYSGNSNATQVAEALTKKSKKETICFVVGENSLRSIQSLLPVEINKKEIVVYKNQPRTTLELHHFDIAIITSPMNATTFLKSGGSADHYISIGNTTSEVLKSLNINSSIAKSPSEIGITESLKGLYKEYYNGVAK